MDARLNLSILSLLLLLLVMAYTQKETHWTASDHNNLIFQDMFLWEIQSRSRLDCARLCADDNSCLAFTFTMTSHSLTCRGHSQPMTSGGDETAATTQYVKGSEAARAGPYYLGSHWLKKNCTSNDTCMEHEPNSVCFEEECLCTPGYYFSVSNDSCQTNCSHLQSDYVMYAKRYISLNNMDTRKDQTFRQCCNWCSSLLDCRSLEYNHKSGKCFVSSVAVLDVADKWAVATKEISYGQRTCL